MKLISWGALLLSFLYLTISTGKLDNSTLTLAILFSLLSVFGDLRDFNFWGLKGTRDTKEKELEIQRNSETVDSKISVETDNSTSEVQEANKDIAPLQLMDNDIGNFLALAFEIERLLRIYSNYILKKPSTSTMSINKLSQELKAKDALTDQGLTNIQDIQWLRNMLVHGRASEINRETIEAGVKIATSFYNDLFNWFNPVQEQQNS